MTRFFFFLFVICLIASGASYYWRTYMPQDTVMVTESAPGASLSTTSKDRSSTRDATSRAERKAARAEKRASRTQDMASYLSIGCSVFSALGAVFSAFFNWRRYRLAARLR
ncbi:MAG: hypothetical protein R3D33_10580 [Hyphomicrobiaceae bacterium]